MNAVDPLFESSIPTLPLLGRGKVRDIYGVGDDHLLIVTTDRLSAYDVVLPDPVPGKGRILTALSNFWFGVMAEVVPNHLSGRTLASVIGDAESRHALSGRAIVVKRLKPLPIEAVARGYLAGSGWRDYQASRQVCGIRLPPGLDQAEMLPQTLYTPATKAEAGRHDENITYDETCGILGERLARRVRDIAIEIYERAAAFALERGIIIADTKFEFGLDDEGRLHLIDEILTPDSSRFWPKSEYAVGTSPPSFDKQYVRDYLDSLGWDRNPPGPSLPPEVIAKTLEKYREALTLLTNRR